MSRRIFFTGVAVMLIITALLPVGAMIATSLNCNGHLCFDAFGEVLNTPHQWQLMRNSLLISSLVALLTVGAGVPLGVILGKTDLPLKKTFTALFTAPLLIPPYIIAVSWFNLTESHSSLFGFYGVVWVLFCAFLPIPMLLTILYLKTVDPVLEEAALLETGWSRTLIKITLPLIAPGIILSAMLTFIMSLGESDVPGFLRFNVFPLESFTRFAAFYDFKAATASALPLGLAVLMLLFAEIFFTGKHNDSLTLLYKQHRQYTIRTGRYSRLIMAILLSALFFTTLMPLLMLIIKSRNISFYVEALNRAGGSLARSIMFASAGAAALTFTGFLTGYLIHTKALRFWRAADLLTISVFALPGTVTGIGLILLWNTPVTNIIYSTPLIIIIGYVAKYTAVTSRITVAGLAQIPSSFDDAARNCGAGWFRRMIYINIPLLSRTLAGGWIAGYIFSMRETAITRIVYPAGSDTLPVRIFTLMANGSQELIAALCIIMILSVLLPAALLWFIPEFILKKRGLFKTWAP